MNVLVVLGHPKQGSFNHALADAAVATLRSGGHEVAFHDLYQERFDPVLPAEEIRSADGLPPLVAEHCRAVSACDGIVIVHPNWWGQPPAILKGWVDRVVRGGVAYRFDEGDSGEGVPIPLLRARAALVLNTTDTPLEREHAEFGDPLDTIWKNCILRYCGVRTVVRRTYGVVVTSTPEMRRRWLDDTVAEVRALFPADARALRR
ncbi:NAD(P)H-dependent oxidoreductase [Anaeromyxobacter sp. Fw109-5]|uniref:NAD(P)H-dependent oxidoreductase n=1 Tax=Anaeromyxobacter sp. (strain Fw109-5) TaxID=404589 RepID=UPI0000ED8A56|nr:NAD(P)H-dependent oxidoreductase [Anaeromyxobacter sp. Fw109-5]ABS27465.1 NAD(P)H dehydrogenase (quinone) [Anaeromyxobacter sp. Fw109-5]